MKTYQALCQFLGMNADTRALSLRHLEIDSRAVQAGDIFCAYQGAHQDGHAYIQDAINQGASLILAERVLENSSVPILVIPNLQEQLSALAAWFYDYPSENLKIIGVTGTNGKTSTTHYLAQFLYLLGQKVAVMGTVGNGLWGALEPSTFTTPEPVKLQRQLAEYVTQGIDYVCMEVSSHALALGRIDHVRFISAVFTNLSQDHLDFHESMDAYRAAKAKFFSWPGLKTVILNKDDAAHAYMAQQTALVSKIYYYSLTDHDSSITFAQDLMLAAQGLKFHLHSPFGQASIQTALLGKFNASNMLAALTTLLSLNFSLAQLAPLSALIHPVKGRMEVLRYPHLPLVVIDYAHTPDALEKALSALKIYHQPLWVVFGCGGDRDKRKRPLMANICETLADTVIVTQDNSRFEAPEKIFADIFAGFSKPEPVTLIPQRGDAILYALTHATKDAIILLAGKGHETYLDIKGVKLAFDERAIVKTFAEAACN